MNAPFDHPLTDREVRWLRHIATHGPLSSEFLLELCSDTHRCRDTGLRTLQKLRGRGYLRLPPQQRQIAKADFHPHAYDLAKRGKDYLTNLGDPETVRPTGHWWHALFVSSITSAIATMAERKGIGYVPAHVILERSGATLAIPTSNGTLIPDQLFALRYPDGFVSFMLEFDRGTEPIRSEAARKSLRRNALQYEAAFTGNLAQSHYGLKSSITVLYFFTKHTRREQFVEILREEGQTPSPRVRCADVPDEFPRFQTLRHGEWRKWLGL